MKAFILLLALSFNVLAGTEYRPVEQYPSNTLNNNNTYKGSELVIVDIDSRLRVAMGFYGTPHQGKEWPYLALLGKVVGSEWKVLATRDPIWANFDQEFPFFTNGDAGVNAYVQSALDHFNIALGKFIQSNGGTVVTLDYWQEFLKTLKTTRLDNGKLVFVKRG